MFIPTTTDLPIFSLSMIYYIVLIVHGYNKMHARHFNARTVSTVCGHIQCPLALQLRQNKVYSPELSCFLINLMPFLLDDIVHACNLGPCNPRGHDQLIAVADPARLSYGHEAGGGGREELEAHLRGDDS